MAKRLSLQVQRLNIMLLVINQLDAQIIVL